MRTTSPQRLRRAIVQAGLRAGVWGTARLPINEQHRAVRSLVWLLGALPTMRRRIRENMSLALGPDVPAQSETLYFRHLGWFLASALSTFHHGVDATPTLTDLKFDDSLRILDDAVAEGRGVVIASPHWSGHELAAAAIGRRHPLVLLVREAPTADRMARKLKWYKALGTEIVVRRGHLSPIKDAVTCLNVLKRGKVLALTPDLLADAGDGVDVQIFGRPARLYGGAFAIALSARAPIIRPFVTWQSNSRAVITMQRSRTFSNGDDRDAAVRTGVQDWCDWFEEKLRANPENWLFWLDKRWSRFLRETQRPPSLV